MKCSIQPLNSGQDEIPCSYTPPSLLVVHNKGEKPWGPTTNLPQKKHFTEE